MAAEDNILMRDGLRELQRRLPPGWRVGAPRRVARPEIDAVARLAAPDRRATSLLVQARRRPEAKALLHALSKVADEDSRRRLLIVAPYMSPALRERLREASVSFVDLTGNSRVVMSEPGLYVETVGAAKDPEAGPRPARSLRGPKAGRVVRTLVDRRQPPKVRELATLARVDPGYVSRVLAFLDEEALVTRVGRGRLVQVDWPRLLRRWASDATFDARGPTLTYLDPRGVSAFLPRLASIDEPYAITGSVAAARFAPLAPPRLAAVYVEDAQEVARRMGLRRAEAGANILLIDPTSDGVFDGAQQHDGLSFAAPSQIAADLLTSPGRGPAEAEELLAWMTQHEEEWRR